MDKINQKMHYIIHIHDNITMSYLPSYWDNSSSTSGFLEFDLIHFLPNDDGSSKCSARYTPILPGDGLI